MTTPPLPEQIELIAIACGGARKISALKALLTPNVSSKTVLQTANENLTATAFIGIRHFQHWIDDVWS